MIKMYRVTTLHAAQHFVLEQTDVGALKENVNGMRNMLVECAVPGALSGIRLNHE